MAQQYTNIRIVLDRVMRHPLLRDMTLETAVDYCVDFIREMGGFSQEKFRYVINEGYCRLPILMKHSDPDIAKIAWILSKYFASRNEIMPEQVIE